MSSQQSFSQSGSQPAAATGTVAAAPMMASNVVVVFGTTGNLGCGVASSFLARGYTVACPVRDAKRIKNPLAKLFDSPRLLIVEEPELDSYEGMRRSLR